MRWRKSFPLSGKSSSFAHNARRHLGLCGFSPSPEALMQDSCPSCFCFWIPLAEPGSLGCFLQRPGIPVLTMTRLVIQWALSGSPQRRQTNSGREAGFQMSVPGTGHSCELACGGKPDHEPPAQWSLSEKRPNRGSFLNPLLESKRWSLHPEKRWPLPPPSLVHIRTDGFLISYSLPRLSFGSDPRSASGQGERRPPARNGSVAPFSGITLSFPHLVMSRFRFFGGLPLLSS